MKPEISVITIVKNDRGIANTLTALEAQKKPAATEVIVVDASDPSRLADIRAAHPAVRWHQFVPAVANKTSIPEQRNAAVALAQGDIIVFIDANCVPVGDWLVELTRPILEGKETMVAGVVRATDPNVYVNINPEHDRNDGYVTTTATSNLAFKKALWETVGKFDESFLYGSDADFTWRCTKAGNRILFHRAAVVTHDWGTFSEEIHRSFRYGKARARILVKHPELSRELLGGNLYITVYTMYFFGLPLTFYIWWYPFIIVLACMKNIGNHPFKTVLMNMIYTAGMWLEFLSMALRTIFSNAAASSATKRP
ncbi:MAG TPA: glycosyltransferase [Candidatus Paceibacterota bacterium]|nr:glycosyltransferase [Candidatus Paceibacterota bacterium]